ncbi:hypothetical protein [Acinetobacter sp. AM]|uniref:hypothetical protein n=1 Tax=Acinetobacter sp. AM TaxID=2170730 RepID=UPI0014027312|nr:hypothetical protein [Acinetobacter sp. AM]
MIKKEDIVVISGSWTDLMTVMKVEDDKVFFATGDYADLSKVRRASEEEIACGNKLD